jgi:hypothetical protein
VSELYRPPLVSQVSANFCGWKVPRGQCDGFLWPYSQFSISSPIEERLMFHGTAIGEI